MPNTSPSMGANTSSFKPRRTATVVAIAFGLVAASAGQALATYSFAQFGPPGTAVSDPATGVLLQLPTVAYTFTIKGPGAGFQVVSPFNQRGHWFTPLNDVRVPLLYDNGAPGAVTVSFQPFVTAPYPSAVGAYFEDYSPGPYSATLTAYDGNTVVGSQTLSGVAGSTDGTQAFVSFFLRAPVITSFVITSTNDGQGWAIGGAPAPEPATWTMLFVGFAGLGAALRARRRVSPALAA